MNKITFLFIVPNPPAVQCVPLYAADTGNLKSITTTFQEAVSLIAIGIIITDNSIYVVVYNEAKIFNFAGIFYDIWRV